MSDWILNAAQDVRIWNQARIYHGFGVWGEFRAGQFRISNGRIMNAWWGVTFLISQAEIRIQRVQAWIWSDGILRDVKTCNKAGILIEGGEWQIWISNARLLTEVR